MIASSLLVCYEHEGLTTIVAWDMSRDHPAPLTAPCAPLKQSGVETDHSMIRDEDEREKDA